MNGAKRVFYEAIGGESRGRAGLQINKAYRMGSPRKTSNLYTISLEPLWHALEISCVGFRFVSVRIDHEECASLPLLTIGAAGEVSAALKLRQNLVEFFFHHGHREM